MATILEANPHIDKVYALESDLQSLMLQVVKEKYDFVLDLHRNLRSRYVKSLLKQVFNSNVKCYTFSKLNINKWLYTTLKWNKMPDISIVDRYFEAVKLLGVKNDHKGLDYYILEESRIQKEDLPLSHVLGYVACAIGGQHSTKKMPVEKWREVISKIHLPIVLLGGEEDFAQAEAIASLDPIKIYNACGKFSLHESADIVRKSRFVISHDTGLMHIAAAFHKPIISIWGNTTPDLGMFPYYGFNTARNHPDPKSVFIEVEKLSCRPCSKIGYNQCPKMHFDCMNKIPIDSIVYSAHQFSMIK